MTHKTPRIRRESGHNLRKMRAKRGKSLSEMWQVHRMKPSNYAFLNLGGTMFELKKIVASAAVCAGVFLPASASALTVNTIECGTLTAANATCGGYEVNLAQHDTQWAFEGTIGDTSGSLTIHTYTDPYWSTGESLGNIRLVIGDYAEGYGATVTWGGPTFDLVYSASQLVYDGVFANFLNIEDNGIDFVLTWTGLQGGEAVSVILTAVPLPAGGLLLLSALGGLGLARRRRSAEPAIA